MRILLVLVVYMAAMVLGVFRPWTDTHALVATDREPSFVKFRCPKVFGHDAAVRGDQLLGKPLDGDEPEGQTDHPVYPVDGRPCDKQSERRVLFVVDLAAAGLGMILLRQSGARQRAADRLHEAQANEVAGP